MKPSPDDTLLDVGGNLGVGFEEIRKYFKECYVVDIDENAMKIIQNSGVIPLVADACQLPFGDNSIDFVFSNAVIEHIDINRRSLFAKEVERVARKGYFVTTPNFWFPYEPHYRCPFWQYMPVSLQKLIKKYISLGNYPKGKYKHISLLSKKDLLCLFNEGNLGDLKVTGFPIPETIYIYWRRAF